MLFLTLEIVKVTLVDDLCSIVMQKKHSKSQESDAGKVDKLNSL